MKGERITTLLNLSCLYAIVWGLFIVNPYNDTFAMQPSLWRPMEQLAPEWLWGSCFIVSGFAAFILDRRKAGAGSFVMAAMFFSIAFLFLMGDFARPGWALIGMLAVFNSLQWRARWNSTGG